MAGDDVNGGNDDNGGGYDEQPDGSFGGSHCSLVFVVMASRWSRTRIRWNRTKADGESPSVDARSLSRSRRSAVIGTVRFRWVGGVSFVIATPCYGIVGRRVKNYLWNFRTIC